MKILHLVEAWHGGIASYVYALIQAQSGDGHQVILVADENLLASDPRSVNCLVETYNASRDPRKLFKIRAQLTDFLRQYAPDVVHVHSTFPGIYMRLPCALHPRIIYTPHGWSFLKKDSPEWIRWIYRQIEKRLAAQARIVMCMSFEELTRARALGIGSANLAMVHTGIPDDLYLKECASLPSDVLADQKLKIGFFGRLDYQKGADLLPTVADHLAGQATVHVYGTEVRGKKPLPVHPRIHPHGWVPHEALAACMAEMDVIIIPSRWEGFSLTALEALRAGVPIVVSNLTSLSEAVVHGYNGLVMQEYSARHLAHLLNNLSKAECRRLGSNARQVFLESFTFDRFYRDVMSLYQTMLSD